MSEFCQVTSTTVEIIKCFFSALFSIYVINYIGWHLNVEPALYSWNQQIFPSNTGQSLPQLVG